MNIDSNPPHLSITGDDISHTALFGAAWTPGSGHTIAATSPQFGPAGVKRYVFTDWSDNGDRLHSITAPQSPTTYTASFRTEHLLTVPVDGGGTVERIPASEDDFYASGTTVQLIPRPNAGMQFVTWTGSLTGIDPNRAVTMDGQRYATALFRGPASTPFNGILNAATLQQTGQIAPGELLTIVGTQGAPDSSLTSQPNPDGSLPTTLGETRVLIDGKYVPIVAVKGNQVTTMVPFSVAGQPFVTVQIEYQGRRSTISSLNIVRAVPGVYTADGSGSGAAGVLNEDGSANADNNPAARGSVISFRITGAGQTEPAGAANAVVGDNPPKPTLPVSVTIGGVDAPVISAVGVKGQLAGVMKVTVKVPDGVSPGVVLLLLRVGPLAARQNVTVAVQ